MVTPFKRQLDKAAAEDLVYARKFGDLTVYTYTQRAVRERVWNEITRKARGIILDEDGVVVARPFDKFFNIFEHVSTEPDNWPKEPFTIEEKVDGSLGIIFERNGQWDVSTKGSLESEQAVFARTSLLGLYDFSVMDPSWTILCEIIYPENRIVVDYGQEKCLRLLAVRNRNTGVEEPTGRLPILASKMGMSARQVHTGENLASQLLSASLSTQLIFPNNSEGYVLKWENGFRVKVKNPWYLAIHKMLDNRSLKRILELVEGGEYRAVFDGLPKELQKDFDDIYAQIRTMIWGVEHEIADAWKIVEPFKDKTRKEFAIQVARNVPDALRSAMFSKLDNYDVRHHVFNIIKARMKDEKDVQHEVE
jgi:RNA ligase